MRTSVRGYGGAGKARDVVRRAVLVALGAGVLVAASLVFPAGAPSTPTVTLRPVNALERPIVARLVAIRRRAGLIGVRYSRELTDAAESHAVRLARTGTFGHRAPGEKPFSPRLQSFYSARGFSYWLTAENIYWNASAPRPDQVVGAWMASLPHRLNILDRRWREVGVAAVRIPVAPGVYGDRDVTIVVIEFGIRRS